MSTVDENIEVIVSPKKIKTVPGKLGTVITEEEFSTLEKMLRSSDTGDHRMAQAILNQCDVQKSIYWIWRLTKDYNSHKMVYLRTKASREFNKESNLFPISYMKATEFAFHLIDKQWITPEIYQYLKSEILHELKLRTQNSNFYDLHITIKETYKELDSNHILTQR